MKNTYIYILPIVEGNEKEPIRWGVTDESELDEVCFLLKYVETYILEERLRKHKITIGTIQNAIDAFNGGAR
jgi:hypothetical protein